MPSSPSSSSSDATSKKRVVRRVVTRTTTASTSSSQQPPQPSPWIPLCFALAIALVLYSFHNLTNVTVHYMHRTRSSSGSAILVLDNVVNETTCQRLHKTAVEFKNRTAGKSVLFQWPLTNSTNNNYIEQVLDCILKQLYYDDYENGNGFFVEYWVRQTWHHTLAHADVDEGHLEEHGLLKHPYKGHVLYLTAGAASNGPTVVFANTTRGGEMYARGISHTATEILVVPFQQARVLQFDGHLLHAVPRPANLWLTGQQADETNDTLLQDAQFARSVVLFNLWHKDQPPPVGLNYSLSLPPPPQADDSIAHRDDDSHQGDESSSSSSSSSTALCNPKSSWHGAPITEDYEESFWDLLLTSRRQLHTFQLPLMGNVIRRGTKDYTLQLQATDLVEKALMDSAVDKRPKRVYLNSKGGSAVLQQAGEL